jgi:hypothetical protein
MGSSRGESAMLRGGRSLGAGGFFRGITGWSRRRFSCAAGGLCGGLRRGVVGELLGGRSSGACYPALVAETRSRVLNRALAARLCKSGVEIISRKSSTSPTASNSSPASALKPAKPSSPDNPTSEQNRERIQPAKSTNRFAIINKLFHRSVK